MCVCVLVQYDAAFSGNVVSAESGLYQRSWTTRGVAFWDNLQGKPQVQFIIFGRVGDGVERHWLPRMTGRLSRDTGPIVELAGARERRV